MVLLAQILVMSGALGCAFFIGALFATAPRRKLTVELSDRRIDPGVVDSIALVRAPGHTSPCPDWTNCATCRSEANALALATRRAKAPRPAARERTETNSTPLASRRYTVLVRAPRLFHP